MARSGTRRCGTHEVYIISIETREMFVYTDQFTGVLDGNQYFRPRQTPGFSIKISDQFALI